MIFLGYKICIFRKLVKQDFIFDEDVFTLNLIAIITKLFK